MQSLRHAFAAIALACLASALATPAARAEERGDLVLPPPPTLGSFPAVTYDESGERVGEARLTVLERDDGSLHIEVRTGAEGGARTHASALLRPVAGREGFRIAHERSRSHDTEGRPLGVLHVDHERGVGTCTPPGGDPEEAETLELPEDDRVANVPLNLLFMPLVRGEVDRVDFQYFLCRGGPRIMDFRAHLAGEPVGRDGSRIIEVSYGPDLGRVGSWLARRLMPKLSFWFEAGQHASYLAHRMPLFSKGPEVVVVREGAAAGALPFLP